MHDRKREELSEADRFKQQRKIQAYKALCLQCSGMQERGIVPPPGSSEGKLMDKLLEINPEYYSMWHLKKSALLQTFSQLEAAKTFTHAGCLPGGGWINEGFAMPPGEALALEKAREIDRALLFSRRVIEGRDQKSYCTWEHRRFLIELLPECQREPRLRKEKTLCETLLSVPGQDRNFHCWDHRRWLCKKLDIPTTEEWAFARARVDKNFSNYSAWHHRSLLLQKMPEGEEKEKAYTEELELLQNAFYTEPQDQSAWIYALWLVGATSKGKPRPELQDTLRAACDELLQDDASLKWPRLCIARMDRAAARDQCSELTRVDPLRSGYYRHLSGAEQHADPQA
eukprot:Hpha_TRINITY_DN12998_c0_g2::TRINITY_DN12998_c0_g2_i1::g.164342::m.164342/K14050/RABGGTA; geranylgeranyl transferase type-2 subunit alpha